MLEAFVGCEVSGYPNPDIERMITVVQLRGAFQNVNKMSFGIGKTKGYAYVNTHWARILDLLEEQKTKLEAMEKEQAGHAEWILTMELLKET